MKIIMKQGSISFHHYKANKDHPLSINKKQRQFLQLIVRLFADIYLCGKTCFLKFSGRCTIYASKACIQTCVGIICRQQLTPNLGLAVVLTSPCTCVQKTSICVYMAYRKCFAGPKSTLPYFAARCPKNFFSADLQNFKYYICDIVSFIS